MADAKHYLAFDVGAESGRGILGRLQHGRLRVIELCRFPNQPVRSDGVLRWNAPELWRQMRDALHTLSAHRVEALESVGVDTWGVDFALLDESSSLLANPVHYRDPRHRGVMERVRNRLGAEFIYQHTGIQFLPFNSLYQLVATAEQTPELLARARTFLTIPDLLNYYLTGRAACEYTNASTTQLLDVHTRAWSQPILTKLELPAHILPPLVSPGTPLGGLLPEVSGVDPALKNTVVIAPACHDTGSAFAAVHSGGDTALLSSGTWSLLGVETAAPVLTAEALRLNFTNEGGVAGTVRLLKNITGMWLLERCRVAWKERGESLSHAELLQRASTAKPLQHLLDPDDPAFAMPADMPSAIAQFCARTGQPSPAGPGETTRAILESLALQYRSVLESLARLTGSRFAKIRVVGGGSQNDLLNQFTADCTGCSVIAGPAEATALGNLAMQMVGSGAVPSVAAARELIAASFPPRTFSPVEKSQWDEAYRRYSAMVLQSRGQAPAHA